MFKKLILLSLATFSAACFAEKVMPMKNRCDESATNYVLNVKQALIARDDTDVSIRGYIVSSLGDEEYWFADATGRIEVEIEDHLFNGYIPSPDQLVTIVGEVEKEWLDISIEVDYLQVH